MFFCKQFLESSLLKRCSCFIFEQKFIHQDKKARKPRLGKFHGYAIKFQNADHFKLSLKRGFTRLSLKEYGLETGIEEMKVLIENRGQNVFRRLNDKKKNQLISIYTEHITNIFTTEDEVFSKYGFIITKVELPSVLNEVLIYWKCFGDERDEVITQHLEISNPSISRKFSESIFGGTQLKLKFIGDRKHLIEEEMNQLFALADYGKQYRSLSHTGAILGSKKETGLETPEIKSNKVPRWINERISNKKKKVNEVLSSQFDKVNNDDK